MASADAPDLKGPLWDFALRFYALPGVAPACLDLQDRFDLDVPLMIAALYARIQGRIVDQAAIATLAASTAGWRDQAIRPLRQIRRNMKVSPWMAAHSAIPAWREGVKALELRAEQIQLAFLGHVVDGLRPDGRSADEASLRATLVLVMQHFADPDVEPPEPAMTLITKAAASAT